MMDFADVIESMAALGDKGRRVQSPNDETLTSKDRWSITAGAIVPHPRGFIREVEVQFAAGITRDFTTAENLAWASEAAMSYWERLVEQPLHKGWRIYWPATTEAEPDEEAGSVIIRIPMVRADLYGVMG